MPDNRLQIIAEMIDKVSPAAKKMERAFSDLNKATSKDFPAAFKKYQTAVAQNEKALANFGRRSESTRKEIKAFQDLIVRTSPTIGRMTEAVGSFAIGTGSAVAAVGAVGAALVVAGKSAVDFAEKMRDLQFGSKSSGLSITDMHQTQQALEQLNISTETSKQAFDSLRSTMSDMRFNTEAYIKSLDGLPDGFKGLANVLITTAKAGAGTKEVFEKIQEQVDYLQEKYPGARGVEIAKRYVTSVARLPAVFGEHGLREINEKLQIIKTLGASDTEIKEAAVQAERLRKAMLENTTILGKWKLNLNTYVTVQFLKVIDLLDSIEAKYNAWFGSSINSLFGGSVGSSPTAPGGGTFADFARSGGGGGGPQGAGPRQYGGSGGGAAPGAAAPGGSGGADTPFSGRFGTWSPASVGGHAGHIPSGATGPLGQTRTPGANIGGPPAPGGASLNIPDAVATEGGSAYLAAQRSALFAEYDQWSPRQKDELAVLMRWENQRDPQVILEAMANRALAEKGTRVNPEGSLWRAMHNSFYGPINTGGVASILNQNRGLGSSEKYQDYVANVRGGSDVLEGRTDQGMLSDTGTPRTPSEIVRRRLKRIHGEYFSDKLGTEAYVHADRARKEEFDRQSNRVNMIAGMSGPPASVNGTGKIDVNVHAGGQTARSQGIFKNLNLQRNIQMQSSNSGPVQQSLPLSGAL